MVGYPRVTILQQVMATFHSPNMIEL